MKIGVPKEIKPQENRIGLTPESVKTLVSEGHEVIIEPMFFCEKKHIDEIIDKLRTGITNYSKSKKN